MRHKDRSRIVLKYIQLATQSICELGVLIYELDKLCKASNYACRTKMEENLKIESFTDQVLHAII